MEAKAEHLKLVQGTISRMAGNSFLLKGWTVTLVSALFAFGAKDADRVFIVIAWIPLIVFAGLDSYYLWQEKLFRELYKVSAAKANEAIDFSMEIEPFKPGRRWRTSLASPTIYGFYGPMAFLLLAVTLYFVLVPHQAPIPIQGPKTITISIQ